jgi:sulfite exporter TauE/SafE
MITGSAALIAGLAGSVHCVAMCGGLAGALGMRRSACPGSWRASIRDAGLHHAGRLAGYSLAGALFGWLGVTLQTVVNLPLLTVITRVAAGILLVLVAARILFGWNTLAGIERLGAHFWRSIRPLAGRAASSRSSAGSFLLGLLWGWLPCGLVYSMLLFAAMSGHAVSGAGIMLAFGLGTLPAMLASSVLSSHIARRLSQPGTRQAIGALLLVFGIWLGVAAVVAGDHADPGHVHQATALSG